MLTFVLHIDLREPPVEVPKLRAKHKRLNIQNKNEKNNTTKGNFAQQMMGIKQKNSSPLYERGLLQHNLSEANNTFYRINPELPAGHRYIQELSNQGVCLPYDNQGT